jgi:hypothetical protein
MIAFCAYSISFSASQIPEKARNEELHDTREQRKQGTESKPEDLFQDLGQMDERMKKRQQKVEPTSRTTVQMEKTGKALLIKDFRKFNKAIPFDQVQEQISLLSLSLIDLDPSNLGSKLETIVGHNGTTYVMTQWRMSAVQSINIWKAGIYH